MPSFKKTWTRCSIRLRPLMNADTSGKEEGMYYLLHIPPLALASPTMAACKQDDPRLLGIKSKIRVVPNFPKPGIMCQDITTLLLDSKAFKDTIDLFVDRYKGKNIAVVAGIEARGVHQLHWLLELSLFH